MRRPFNRHPITLACAALAPCLVPAAWAQTSPAPATPAPAATPAPTPTQTVEVPGIRLSLERSLETKKLSDALVEVVSAEDVGKMPDKNLADSLQRLPTVAVRTDYDEAEKVSMRGTNPDMTLIIFNGHTVSGGDWFIADQQSSSRSTSLSLMPSSVLNQALVYRTSQANIADGGLAGTINVTTRKPLEARQRLGGTAMLGASHATLPGRSAPDVSATVNWKNASNTFGVIGQVFAEKRYVRRDSLSRNGFNFGWTTIDVPGVSSNTTTPMRGITDASLAGTGLKAADLNGVRMPSAMGSEFVEGVRDRKGGMVSLQWRPIDAVDLTLTSFQSKMNANNYGRLNGSAMEAMLRGQSFYASASEPNLGTLPATRVYAQIRNPVIATGTTYWGDTLKYLQSAEVVFPAGTRPALVGLNDNSYRDGASATSGFTDIEARFRLSDRMVVKSMLSTTEGRGETREDQGIGWYRFGTGVTYSLNGLGSAPQFATLGAGENRPGINADGSGYQAFTQRNSRSRTIDKEQALALNAEYEVNWNGLTMLDVGLRHADHKRNFQRWVYTRKRVPYDPLPTTGLQSFPDDFASAIGGGYQNTGFYYDQNTIQAWIDNQWRSYGDNWDRLMSSAIDMRELQQALYAMQSFEVGKLSGNVGLRLVRTQVDANIINQLPAGLCVKSDPTKPTVPCAAFPRAIVDAADLYNHYDTDVFGRPAGSATVTTAANYTRPFYFEPTRRTFYERLPSVNLRYELQRDMLLRAGASRTMGRQNYNVWGQGVTSPTCNAQTGICTVSGPNPNLRPLRSDNLDLNWSWYFARRSLVTVGYFKSYIDGYTKFGNLRQDSTIELVDPADNQLKTYFLTSAGQQKARIEGFDVGYEQPIGRTGFGFTSNISRANTSVEDGRPMTGASEWAGNFGIYYEDAKLSARLVINYRSEYVNTATAPAPTTNTQTNTVIQGVTLPATALTWAAPVTNVAFSAGYRFTPNLELLFSATNLTNPVRGQYRYGEYEEQKQDVSGRQYYLNLKVKY